MINFFIIFQTPNNCPFIDLEAEDSSGADSDILFERNEADINFIDDSMIDDEDNMLEIQKEHHRNVKRIAKNLDEFADSLTFEFTNIRSLKDFILQML